MEIKHDNYHILYDPAAAAVIFKGSLRPSGGDEYSRINALLTQAAERHERLTLDLRVLQFLNSSGINMLSKFVIGVRRKGGLHLAVLGSAQIPWQGTSLRNLQRLMPDLQLSLE